MKRSFSPMSVDEPVDAQHDPGQPIQVTAFALTNQVKIAPLSECYHPEYLHSYTSKIPTRLLKPSRLWHRANRSSDTEPDEITKFCDKAFWECAERIKISERLSTCRMMECCFRGSHFDDNDDDNDDNNDNRGKGMEGQSDNSQPPSLSRSKGIHKKSDNPPSPAPHRHRDHSSTGFNALSGEASQSDSEASTGILTENISLPQIASASTQTRIQTPAFLDSLKSVHRAILKGVDSLASDVKRRQQDREEKVRVATQNLKAGMEKRRATVKKRRAKRKELGIEANKEELELEQLVTDDARHLEAAETLSRLATEYQDVSKPIAERENAMNLALEKLSEMKAEDHVQVGHMFELQRKMKDKLQDVSHASDQGSEESEAEDALQKSDLTARVESETGICDEVDDMEGLDGLPPVYQCELFDTCTPIWNNTSHALGRPPEISSTQPRTEPVVPMTKTQRKKANRKMRKKGTSVDQDIDALLPPPSFEMALKRFRHPKIVFDEACVPIQWRERVYYANVYNGSNFLDKALSSLDLDELNLKIQTEVLHWFESKEHCEAALEDAIRGLGQDLGLKLVEGKASETRYLDAKSGAVDSISDSDLIFDTIEKESGVPEQGKVIIRGFIVRWFRIVMDEAEKVLVFEEQLRPSSPVGIYPDDLEETVISGAARMFDVATTIPAPKYFAAGDDVLAWLVTLSHHECVAAVFNAAQGLRVNCGGLKLEDRNPKSTQTSRTASTEQHEESSTRQEESSSMPDQSEKDKNRQENGTRQVNGTRQEDGNCQEDSDRQGDENRNQGATPSIVKTLIDEIDDLLLRTVEERGVESGQLRNGSIDAEHEANQCSEGHVDDEHENDCSPHESIDDTIANQNDSSGSGRILEPSTTPQKRAQTNLRGGGLDTISSSALRSLSSEDFSSILSPVINKRSHQPCAHTFLPLVPDYEGFSRSPDDWLGESHSPFSHINDFPNRFLALTAPILVGRPVFSHLDVSNDPVGPGLLNGSSTLEAFDGDMKPELSLDGSLKEFMEDFSLYEASEDGTLYVRWNSKAPMLNNESHEMGFGRQQTDTGDHEPFDQYEIFMTELPSGFFSIVPPFEQCMFPPTGAYDSNSGPSTEKGSTFLPLTGPNDFGRPNTVACSYEYMRNSRRNSFPPTIGSPASVSSQPADAIFMSTPLGPPAYTSPASSVSARSLLLSNNAILSSPLLQVQPPALVLPSSALKSPLPSIRCLWVTVILPPDSSLESLAESVSERGAEIERRRLQRGVPRLYMEEYIGLWKAMSCRRCCERRYEHGHADQTNADGEREKEIGAWDAIRALGGGVNTDKGAENKTRAKARAFVFVLPFCEFEHDRKLKNDHEVHDNNCNNNTVGVKHDQDLSHANGDSIRSFCGDGHVPIDDATPLLDTAANGKDNDTDSPSSNSCSDAHLPPSTFDFGKPGAFRDGLAAKCAPLLWRGCRRSAPLVLLYLRDVLREIVEVPGVGGKVY